MRPTAITREEKRVKELTLPASSKMTETAELARHDFVLRSTWAVDTPLNWDDYRQLVGQRFGGEYQPGPSTEQQLRFTKRMPGDVAMVEITQINGTPTRVRISFQSHADGHWK